METPLRARDSPTCWRLPYVPETPLRARDHPTCETPLRVRLPVVLSTEKRLPSQRLPYVHHPPTCGHVNVPRQSTRDRRRPKVISDQWSASPQREPEKEAKNMNIENSPQKGADGGGDQQHIVYTYIFPPPLHIVCTCTLYRPAGCPRIDNFCIISQGREGVVFT